MQVRQERDALEAMRVDFEHELQHAQTEVAKAQDALKSAEDRVRASEQVERQKIISGGPCPTAGVTVATDVILTSEQCEKRRSFLQRARMTPQVCASEFESSGLWHTGS